MASSFFAGRRVREVELLDLFPPNEGSIIQYYGRIGGGKTYAATADILEALRQGRVVYANWRIHYEGTDERVSVMWALLGVLWPWHHRFYKFPPENLKYFEFSDEWAKTQGFKKFEEWLETRTDCIIVGDEGHVMFDSYQSTRMSMTKRAAVLHTRHFERSIWIISQRPTAIHVSMRANVNQFYRCECQFKLGPLVYFKRTEFQDMTAETVDEQEEKIVSTRHYWGQQKVFDAYDSTYLRGEVGASQRVLFEAYDYPYLGRVLLLLHNIWASVKPHKREKVIHTKPKTLQAPRDPIVEA